MSNKLGIDFSTLSDGQFHQLCDELMRGWEARYRSLKGHGVNIDGKSIKGQPDSYVGDTADSCDIAFCYSQEKRWWTKIEKDVQHAKRKSPNVTEIVTVISHDKDRTSPKKGNYVDWLKKAKAAANPASFRIVDGPELVEKLNKDRQDLRLFYFNIPYSRLTRPQLLDAAKKRSLRTIDEVSKSRQFVTATYVRTGADRLLTQLWKQLIAKRDRGTLSRAFLPLVAEAGMGKTRLLSTFVQQNSSSVPIIYMEARDIDFARREGLMQSVVTALQGNLDSSQVTLEERFLVDTLASSIPLTVVIDGLDETHDPKGVRLSINSWLNSDLGSSSVFITTSRPEFWKQCLDRRWESFVATGDFEEWLSPPGELTSTMPTSIGSSCFNIPKCFNAEELQSAVKLNRIDEACFWSLSNEARLELTHPFTFAAFCEVTQDGTSFPTDVGRAEILELWMNRRIQSEESAPDRITTGRYHSALKSIARAIDRQGSLNSISIDELPDNIPGYTRSEPPGAVVERLINSGLLETTTNDTSRIRFSTEAIQEFWLASGELDCIAVSPEAVARQFSAHSFSDAKPKLEVIGNLVWSCSKREEFVRELSRESPYLAAVVISKSPRSFSSELRTAVCKAIGKDVGSKHSVDVAFAMETLGAMRCIEAADVLVELVENGEITDRHLRKCAADAFLKLNCTEKAGRYILENEYWRTRTEVDGPYFLYDDVSKYRALTAEMKESLILAAREGLKAPSEHWENRRARFVLALLQDEALVQHLEQKGDLTATDYRCLIAVGSKRAGALYARKLNEVAKHLDENDDEDRLGITLSVRCLGQFVTYVMQDEFARELLPCIRSSNLKESWLASDLLIRANCFFLFDEIAKAQIHRASWIDFSQLQRTTKFAINPVDWLNWWKNAENERLLEQLLDFVPRFHTHEIDAALYDAMGKESLRARACAALADSYSLATTTKLMAILENELAEGSAVTVSAIDALGVIADPSCVETIFRVARSSAEWYQLLACARCLGRIGTNTAIAGLIDLHKINRHEIWLFGLAIQGSEDAVQYLSTLAIEETDPPNWLFSTLCGREHLVGWRSGHYYQLRAEELVVDFFKTHGAPSLDDKLQFCSFGGTPLTTFFRSILMTGSLTQNEKLALENFLSERGDPHVISNAFFDEESDDGRYLRRLRDRLTPFPKDAITSELRKRVSKLGTASETIRHLVMLGDFGDKQDADYCQNYVDNPDPFVSGIAREALLRLTDPARLPRNWRQL